MCHGILIRYMYYMIHKYLWLVVSMDWNMEIGENGKPRIPWEINHKKKHMDQRVDCSLMITREPSICETEIFGAEI